MVGLYEGGADINFTPWDLTWVPPIYPPCQLCRPFSQKHHTAVWDSPTSWLTTKFWQDKAHSAFCTSRGG